MREMWTVVQKTPGIFQFASDQNRQQVRRIYLKTGTGFGEFLLETRESNFEVEALNLDGRPYFTVSDQDGDYTVGERTLPVGGMNNFRDMGGYETGDGKHVRWGMLYRSDHFCNTTDDGLAYLQKLGLHTVIDYRSADETEKYPNRIIAEYIRTYQLDPSAHTAELSAQFTSSKADEDRNLVKKIAEQKEKGLLKDRYGIVMEQYHNFVSKEACKMAYARMLQIAADPSSPAIVQHCRGGKDRTGFGAMLLLGILGVRKEAMVSDYMLTYTNRIDRNKEKMEGYRKLTDDQDVLNYLYSLIETRPEFIEASITSIEEQYGDIRTYAVKELGIAEEMIETMRGLYLE